MNIEIKEFRTDRTVYITDEINANTVAQAKKDIESIIQSDNDVIRHNSNELKRVGVDIEYECKVIRPGITIDLTSPGGSIYHGLGLYDYICKVSKTYKTKCVASGFIASMATIIILACKERVGMDNTSYMIHSLSDLSYGKMQDLRDSVEEDERINKRLIDIYTKNTKITEEQLNEIIKLKKDWWFDSKKAFEIGLINSINY